jgi:hypothetical protein
LPARQYVGEVPAWVLHPVAVAIPVDAVGLFLLGHGGAGEKQPGEDERHFHFFFSTGFESTV